MNFLKKKAYLITTLSMLLLFPVAYSQQKFEFDAGVGLFEAISLKAKYGNMVQLGICQGFIGRYIFHSAIELYYHPVILVRQDKRIPLYLTTGVGSTFLSTAYQNHMTTFYPRAGWSFKFSKRTGLNIDVGPCFFRIIDTDGSKDWSVTPSGSIHFYVKV